MRFRMPASSEPLPLRRERFAPTRPSGCGASARESYGAVIGSTRTCWPSCATGPNRKPAQRVYSATFSSPDRPDRHVALKRRQLPELLAEELRRLDEDDVYAATARKLMKLPAS